MHGLMEMDGPIGEPGACQYTRLRIPVGTSSLNGVDLSNVNNITHIDTLGVLNFSNFNGFMQNNRSTLKQYMGPIYTQSWNLKLLLSSTLINKYNADEWLVANFGNEAYDWEIDINDEYNRYSITIK